jgi:predicted amidophosphoribosyltransferase
MALRKSLKAKKGAEASAEPNQDKVDEVPMLVKAADAIPPADIVDREIPDVPSSTGLCASCGAEARDDDNFCAKCGKSIERERLCPNCGAKLAEDDAFCRKCGTEIKTAHQ